MAFLNKNTALAVAALVACGSAAATEDYDLRYAPGYGGADMSAPFEGGWVFQAHAYVYSGNIRSTTVGTPTDVSAAIGAPAGSLFATPTIHSNTQINVNGILPRLSYMSSTTFLGATLGGTVLLPIVHKGSSVSLTGLDGALSGPAVALLNAQQQAAILGGFGAAAHTAAKAVTDGNSARSAGIGDVEFSPILRWSTENTQTLFVLTTVAPTGDYDQTRAANPSAGKFWTFRPAVQYSWIGDGWDVGGRVAYSYNTRNTETHYKSGSYVNVDLAAMKSVSESTRVGVSAYAVDQLNKDTSTMTPQQCVAQYGGVGPCTIIEARQAATLDEKGRVFGIGPEVAYIHGAGDYLLEGRVMREFGTQTRPKGFTAIVSLSKPF
jgi:hypothetical protein